MKTIVVFGNHHHSIWHDAICRLFTFVAQVDPNPPKKMICSVITEDVPYCERENRKVEETREVEVCTEAPPEISEREKKLLSRKKLTERLEKIK